MSIRDGLGRGQARENRRLELGLSSLTQGVCEEVDWVNGLAVVNVGGGSIPMPMTGHPPLVGWKVWVGYLGEQPVCLGMVPRSPLGTTQGSASGGRVTVLADDGQTYAGLPYLGASPSASTRVEIDWTDGGIVQPGALSAEPTGDTPNTPAAPTPTEKTFVFNPTGSGNWYNNSSWATGPDPHCSDLNDGTYFYGNTIPDSIPDSAVFVPGTLQIYLKEYFNQYPSSLATLGLHNLAAASGAPNPTQTFAVPNCYPNGAWVTLPNSWEDELRLGSARGVAFNGGGFHKYRRAGVDGSGTIVGRWRVTA
jgi:hypothetical protein